MKNWLRLFFAPSYWKYSFSKWRAAKALLSAFGSLWLIVEVLAFFSQPAAAWLRTHWHPFLLVGIAWALWENRPRHLVCHRLMGRDLWIEVKIADMFRVNGALIIGCNTLFDTDIHSGLISPRSVQGQFTTKYYEEIRFLDRDIEEQLEGVAHTEAPEVKKSGKSRLYPVGTVVKLRARGRTAYLVAIATINPHGSAQSSFEDLKVSLAKLWEYIGDRGDRETLVMPVLGTGYSRLTQTRTEVIHEIISSFVAGCASKLFCERLTIVIPPHDFFEHEINLEELGQYLRHVCSYTEYKSPAEKGSGTAIG